MTEKERLDKIAELRSDMKSMLEVAKSEKRNLSAEEQATFDGLSSDVRMHENFRLANELTPEAQKQEADIRSIFAQRTSEAVQAGKSTTVEMRAAPIDSVDVADTIPILYKDILEALEPALVIDKLGLKMQTNVKGEPMWPTVAGVEATIEGENVSVSDSELTFGKIKASPKRVAISIPVSRRAFYQSNLDLYGIVTTQLGKAVARTLNKWLVANPAALVGASNSVFVKAAPDVDFAVDAAPTYAEIVALETKVMNSNVAADESGAYIMSPSMVGYLKSTAIANNDHLFISDGKTLNGYPIIVSSLMGAGKVGFGFFSYAVVSQFGDVSVIIDPYTGAKENKVNFVLNSDYDITVLRPEAFAIGYYVA